MTDGFTFGPQLRECEDYNLSARKLYNYFP
jgi:hypothetical protein